MKITLDTAKDIIEHHFGKAPKDLQEIHGGSVNFVYKAFVDKDAYIVRISEEASKLQFFLKEQWAVRKAEEHKIPVAKILEVANVAAQFPYMIIEFISGDNALARPSNDRINIIREMGKYTSMINSIPTSGYGHVFDWSNNQLSRKESWADFIEKELEVSKRLAFFEKHNIFEAEFMTKLRSVVKDMMTWNNKPTLNHGDIRLKNIIVNDKGKISSILDWETCISGIAPHWDLSIALHDLTIDEKDAFLDGYGITPKEYRNRAQAIKALNVINYAGYVEAAYAEKDEKKRKECIEVMKNRLRGSFDLYSL